MLTPSRRAAAGEAVEEEVDGESWVGVCVAENAREGEKRACAPPPFSLSSSHTRNSPTNRLAARAAVARAWPAEARKEAGAGVSWAREAALATTARDWDGRPGAGGAAHVRCAREEGTRHVARAGMGLSVRGCRAGQGGGRPFY